MLKKPGYYLYEPLGILFIIYPDLSVEAYGSADGRVGWLWFHKWSDEAPCWTQKSDTDIYLGPL